MPIAIEPSSRQTLLEEQWTEFLALPQSRLARWLGPAEDFSSFESWIDVQNGKSATDIIVLLDAPFEDPGTYGHELSKSFQQRYAHTKSLFTARQLRTDWICPLETTQQAGHRAFAWTCVSFLRHHAPALQRLTVSFHPKSVAVPDAFEEWLIQLVSGNIPESIRFMVFDVASTPTLSRLASMEGDKVRTLPLPHSFENESLPDSDREAAEALLGHHLAALSNHAAEKDLESADREASSGAGHLQKEPLASLGDFGADASGCRLPDGRSDRFSVGGVRPRNSCCGGCP